MKVAHLTTVDLSLRFLVLPQLKAIVQKGGEALGISAPGPWVPELEEAGVRHIPLSGSTRSMNVLADLRAAIHLWRILRREQPDVLHTHNPKPGLYGRIVGRLAGVPVVVNTVHGLYAAPEDSLMKRGFVYVLESLASRFSDAELVQSREDLETMRRLRIATEAKLGYLGNGVDLARFDPDKSHAMNRGRLREELGVEPDQILVGTVGRLVREKGYLELFEAAEGLGDGYRILCIGPEDPSKADALDSLMVEQARESGVIFTGMRDDVEQLYAAMDLFVLPSHREGFPRAAMEACAMGLPVVATDIRGCREVVDDGVNGVLVPVREAGALRSAIRALGGDPERRARMGSEARRIAEERFDEHRVVGIVLDTYRRVAQKKGIDLLTNRELGDVTLREGEVTDAPFMASLHIDAIGTGFLPKLGGPFMRLLYRALARDPMATVLVAEDDAGPVGFVAGVTHTGAFYKRFAVRYGVIAGLLALPKLIRPSIAARAMETFRYGRGEASSEAELLSMAVIPEARGRGVGTRLGARLLRAMAGQGIDEVRVVVGAENAGAITAYQRMGFGNETLIEVHAGEASTELTWRR